MCTENACDLILPNLVFVPVHIFSTLFTFLLVPYLRITLKFSNEYISLVLVSGFIPSILMQSLVGCSVLSRFKRNSCVIRTFYGIALVVLLSSSMLLVSFPILFGIQDESISGLKIGLVALFYGLMRWAISVYFNLIPFLIPGKMWQSDKIYLLMLFIGSGISVGILFSTKNLLTNIHMLMGAANGVTLLILTICFIWLCLKGQNKRFLHSKEKRLESNSESCLQFFNHFESVKQGILGNMWFLWVSNLVFGGTVGSFVFFIPDWYVWKESLLVPHTNPIFNVAADYLSSVVPVFSYFLIVQILGVGLLIIITINFTRCCTKKETPFERRSIFVVWHLLLLGTVLSVAAFLSLAHVPNMRSWMVSLLFGSLGFYSVADSGLSILNLGLLKVHWEVKGSNKVTSRFLKTLTGTFTSAFLVGQAIGVVLTLFGISHFGYSTFLKMNSVASIFSLIFLALFPCVKSFDAIKLNYDLLPEKPVIYSNTQQENRRKSRTHHTSISTKTSQQTGLGSGKDVRNENQYTAITDDTNDGNDYDNGDINSHNNDGDKRKFIDTTSSMPPIIFFRSPKTV